MSVAAQGPRGSSRPLSVGGHVLLGLLLDGPATGWDLIRAVERSVGHFWPLTRAHVYAELPKIADRGWATAVDIPQTRAPDKRLYAVTETGREAFRRWLDTVELVEERGRQPLQLRLFFAAHSDPARFREILDLWRSRAAGAQDHCVDILRSRGFDVDRLPVLTLSGAEPVDEESNSPATDLDPRGLTALFGLRRAQADLIWLDEVGGGTSGNRPTLT